MKNLLICILLVTSVCMAGENKQQKKVDKLQKDSTAALIADSSLVDSLNISRIVKSQVEAALTGNIKSSINYQLPAEVKKPEILNQETKKESLAGSKFPDNVLPLFVDFSKKYLNVMIFISVSMIVAFFVVIRRLLKRKTKISKGLKKNIELIRNEKPVVKKNNKLKLLRKGLSDSSELYDMSENKISQKAKDMNVGKGELMLAAKIKAFQLSKIFK